jgi:hypothetical protein
VARRSSACTQADLTKLIKAAIAAGVGKEHIVGVRLDRDGATLLFGEQKPLQLVGELPAAGPSNADASWGDVDAT